MREDRKINPGEATLLDLFGIQGEQAESFVSACPAPKRLSRSEMPIEAPLPTYVEGTTDLPMEAALFREVAAPVDRRQFSKVNSITVPQASQGTSPELFVLVASFFVPDGTVGRLLNYTIIETSNLVGDAIVVAPEVKVRIAIDNVSASPDIDDDYAGYSSWADKQECVVEIPGGSTVQLFVSVPGGAGADRFFRARIQGWTANLDGSSDPMATGRLNT